MDPAHGPSARVTVCRCVCHAPSVVPGEVAPALTDPIATLTACDLCRTAHPPVCTLVTPRRRTASPYRDSDGDA